MENEAKKITELEKIFESIYANDKKYTHYGINISQRNDIKKLVKALEKDLDELKGAVERILPFLTEPDDGSFCRKEYIKAYKDLKNQLK